MSAGKLALGAGLGVLAGSLLVNRFDAARFPDSKTGVVSTTSKALLPAAVIGSAALAYKLDALEAGSVGRGMAYGTVVSACALEYMLSHLFDDTKTNFGTATTAIHGENLRKAASNL